MSILNVRTKPLCSEDPGFRPAATPFTAFSGIKQKLQRLLQTFSPAPVEFSTKEAKLAFRLHPVSVPVCNVQGPVTEVELDAKEYWEMAGDSRWRMIICLRGEVWITQARDLRDYVLTAGEMFLVTQSGPVLVQALQDASLQVTPSLAAVPPYVGRFENTIFS